VKSKNRLLALVSQDTSKDDLDSLEDSDESLRLSSNKRYAFKIFMSKEHFEEKFIRSGLDKAVQRETNEVWDVVGETKTHIQVALLPLDARLNYYNVSGVVH
jgi:hypothetical protein